MDVILSLSLIGCGTLLALLGTYRLFQNRPKPNVDLRPEELVSKLFNDLPTIKVNYSLQHLQNIEAITQHVLITLQAHGYDYGKDNPQIIAKLVRLILTSQDNGGPGGGLSLSDYPDNSIADAHISKAA